MFEDQPFESEPRVHAAAAEALPRCENSAGHPRQHHPPFASHKVEYQGSTTLVCGHCAKAFRRKSGAVVTRLNPRQS